MIKLTQARWAQPGALGRSHSCELASSVPSVEFSNFFPVVIQTPASQADIILETENTKGGSITVQLTSCLTNLFCKKKNVSCHTAYSEPV